MSAFTGELTVTSLDVECTRWRLEQPLIYEVGEKGSGRVVLVPSSFETDVTSVPVFMRSVLPAWGKWSRAAILHDRLYRLIEIGCPHEEAPDREAADAVFYEALRVSEVNPLLSWLMWAAVRVFGASRLRVAATSGG